MKKQTHWLAPVGLLFLLMAALPSCKKGCYKCTGEFNTNIICEDDYDSQKEFKDALDYAEAFGYECKK